MALSSAETAPTPPDPPAKRRLFSHAKPKRVFTGPVPKSEEKYKYLLAGAAAGAVSRTCTAPIERVKVLLQVQSMRRTGPAAAAAAAAKNQPPEFRGLFASLKLIFKEEGWQGFFRGNGTNVARVAPSAAVRFMSYEFLKDKLLRVSENPHKLPTHLNLLAGAGAGLVSTVSTYPLDLLRSRLSVQTGSSRGRSTGLAHAFRSLVKKEGVRGLYNGVTTSLYGAVPYVALNFSFYEFLKRQWLAVEHPEDRGNDSGKAPEPPSPLASLACGGLAGSAAMTCTYSFELIRRRMMVQGMDGIPKMYTGTADAFFKIVKADGVLGLYSGIGPNYFKVVPSMAIAFLTYETCKQLMNLK